VGEANVEPVIRKALALGGDKAVRINTITTDTTQVATAIANYAQANGYTLLLTGKESIDYNNASTGAMIAELLDMPYIAQATKIEVAGNVATINREIEGGEETATCSLPMVISCQKGVAEARIPNMRGIMASRTKPLEIIEANAIAAPTQIVSYELPHTKTGVKMIDANNMDELVRLLHEEAKVI
jgi:electron transfer flavoprotein beta subunit